MKRFPPIEYPGNVTGILYEPRAVWSVQTVDTSQTANGRVSFPRNDFLNPSKYPIVLTQLLLAPINYTYREANRGNVQVPAVPSQYQVGGASALGVSSILINAPQRQNYSRRVIPMTSWPAEPRWTPSLVGQNRGQAQNDPYPSSVWGTTRWEFDHPMVMTKLGTLEIGLSGVSMNSQIVPDPGFAETQFAISVTEGPEPGHDAPGTLGNFPGNVRLHPRSTLGYTESFSPIRTSGQGGLGVANGTTQQQIFTAPFPPVTLGTPFDTTQQWPPTQALTAREYDAQNPNRDGSSPVTGFSVMIDQIGYDDEMVIKGPTQNAADLLSPLAFRVAARARTRNGGTGEWWWRPGAPLALVQPTITPAICHRLAKPITLAPGDTLDVELQTQRPIDIDGNVFEPTYNVGISFCGFAAIE